ncbi:MULTISPECIES: LysM peptidoglycan-binding and 3D domain-containing protein [Bacillus]|uniref:LysM peptidoglycan-binding domain-containing protein n=1 Tax=Bacillus salipaludis TaxID=2547811 RepID=A0A4R5VVY8_9BACI|nr:MULTISPECIES: 3D domain-containing protein [Bacillus]MDQ6597586.1 LysM peptidoglycan-binding domain-containing protein [Bacillus salipaludis]TDK63000.1 LysM peptidoglycan-binding domain-containing protein [Bacillus salipaludis]
MLNKIKTFMAAVVLSGTVSANVHAATITVQEGDTLSNLASVNHTKVENIRMLNHLTSDLIFPGERLEIAPEKHYIVKQDETLLDIAKRHHVSVSQIKEWNHLISDLIHPGLDLIIFEDVSETKSKKQEASEVTKQDQVDSKDKATSHPKKQAAKQITVKATAYTASCEGCSGITKTGVNIKANPNAKVIAVDPNVIPLGSKVYVEGFGEATAADTGSAIKGNRIDVFIPSEADAIDFGVKQLKVTILN